MANENTEDEDRNYDILITRAKTVIIIFQQLLLVYEKQLEVKTFFLCREVYNEVGKWIWNPSINADCCIKYEIWESLENGTLPTGIENMKYLITLRAENNGEQVNNINFCAVHLVLQWIYCTVYPHTMVTVEESIRIMDGTYKALKKYSSKTPSEKHWTTYCSFLEQQTNLFDIRALSGRQKYQESLWGAKMSGAKMSAAEEDFYKNQKLAPRVGYCSSFVDWKWQLSNKRKIAGANKSRKE